MVKINSKLVLTSSKRRKHFKHVTNLCDVAEYVNSSWTIQLKGIETHFSIGLLFSKEAYALNYTLSRKESITAWQTFFLFLQINTKVCYTSAFFPNLCINGACHFMWSESDGVFLRIDLVYKYKLTIIQTLLNIYWIFL